MFSLMQNFYSKIRIWLKHTIADNKWTIMSVKFLHPSSNSLTWRSWDPHMKCIFTWGFRNTAKVNSNLTKPSRYFATCWSWYFTHLFKAFTLHSRDAKKTHSWPVWIPIPNRTSLYMRVTLTLMKDSCDFAKKSSKVVTHDSGSKTCFPIQPNHW